MSDNGAMAASSPDDSVSADDAGLARAVGRPRSEAVSQAILDATLDLITEHGSVGAVSVEAVAARSGASKTTIYRRWATKEALVAAAVDSIKSPPSLELPHESVRDDLIRLGRNLRTSLSENERGILRSIMFEAASNPELRRQQDRYLARRRETGRAVFRYWVEHGGLRPDTDIGLAAAMFINTLLMIMVYDHYPELRSPDLVERCADQLLQGIGAEDAPR